MKGIPLIVRASTELPAGPKHRNKYFTLPMSVVLKAAKATTIQDKAEILGILKSSSKQYKHHLVRKIFLHYKIEDATKYVRADLDEPTEDYKYVNGRKMIEDAARDCLGKDFQTASN